MHHLRLAAQLRIKHQPFFEYIRLQPVPRTDSKRFIDIIIRRSLIKIIWEMSHFVVRNNTRKRLNFIQNKEEKVSSEFALIFSFCCLI